MSLPTSRAPWSYEELVIACGLYFTLPFGQMHARNPKIIEVAELLGRTPSSLAMKLVNFASMDPAHKARGVRGLQGHSRNDERVWNEFRQSWNTMAILSETKLHSLYEGKFARSELKGRKARVRTPLPPDTATEAEATVRVRTMQSFFRKLVLAAYDYSCCVTGNPVEDLLVASHILPWSEFPEHRLNPANGLCLAAHFDRAFDRRLIAFDDDFRLLVSPTLKRYLPNKAIELEFLSREGTALVCPDRFSPSPEFLAYHRTRLFKRG